MTAAGSDEAVAKAFEAQRGRLVAIAYRMLGSRADAEDAMQEAWLRLARQDAAAIDNLPAWLTTVVGRVCIDMLRSRKARPESAFDDPLPGLVVTEDSGEAPEDNVLMADSVGLALLVVLDTLSPAERLAFVMHDIFEVQFEEVGRIIGKSTDASKMLASRARRKVRGMHRRVDTRQRQRAVVDAFIAAARDGDFEGLLRVLDPELTWRTHTTRGVMVKHGAAEAAAKIKQATGANVTAHRVLVNGEPGVLVWGANGKPQAVMACTVVDGRIVEILALIDPKRLATLSLPARPA